MSLRTVHISMACMLLFCTGIYAQTFQWAHGMGSTDWEQGTAIALDGSGNVYHTGYFRGTVDFDAGPGVFNLTAGGTQDVFISKTDASGNFVWAKQLGGAGWEECHGIAIDDLGNIYTTGFFLGAADFDPAATSFNLTSGPGGDAFICKLDPSGNFTWAKQIRGTQAVTAYAIAVDDSGNVYTTGYFDGTTDFNPGPSMYYLTVAGYSDIFISKLDASGNFVWARQLKVADGEVGYSIALDAGGNIYTTGTFYGTVDFDPGTGVYNLGSPGTQDIYISKLDASGNFAWARQVGGETGYAIAVDNAGNVYATGYYGWNDIEINKLDASGNVTWTKQFGASVGYSLAVDSSCNVYTTGIFYGTRDFDPGAGTFSMTSIGSSDSYVSMLDSSGNFAWAIQLGGTNEVLARAIGVYGNGNVYTTGSFDGTADFNPAASTYNLTSTGSYDIFLHKLRPGEVGLSENSFAGGFRIYPNPTEGNLVIEFGQEHDSLALVLKTITGQIIAAKLITNSNRAELQIEAASGVYILEISGRHDQKAVARIIKQ